jgi:hypothetical protein
MITHWRKLSPHDIMEKGDVACLNKDLKQPNFDASFMVVDGWAGSCVSDLQVYWSVFREVKSEYSNETEVI